MTTDATRQQQLVSLFHSHPCWMIEPLTDELGCSVPSTRRYLKAAGYYSSFTHNGKWYTLKSIPRFDRDGLWFHELIGFSRAGSLTGTLIQLVGRSPAGLTAQQLGVKLRCRCHSVLVQLCRHGKLARRPMGRSHLYLAVDQPVQAAQLQVLAGNQPAPALPAEIAVLILAEFIRQPELSFEELAAVVGGNRQLSLKAAQVADLFVRHGLKKTTRPARPEPCGP
jgi:hypothetical protein